MKFAMRPKNSPIGATTDIASATLSTARLTEAQWLALIPELPVRARGFLRLRRDLPEKVDALLERLGVHDRALPLPPEPEPLVEQPGVETESRPEPTLAGDNREHDDEDIVDGEYTEVDDDESVEPEPQDGTMSAGDVATAAGAVAAGVSGADANDDVGNQPQSEITALRHRIEAFQRAREEGEPRTPREPVAQDHAAPTLPFADESTRQEELTGFGFSTDTGGTIDWADSFAASRVMYLSLPSILPEELSEAIERQLPLHGLAVTLEGGPAIEGEWILDAQPRFSSPDGRFLGYAGGFRRPLRAEEPGNQSDRLRQLLHELRTPVNAIQGFAEVIQQQVVGPVPHDYRALAAGIAGDSARMLAGFDDLERLSRLESGRLRPTGGDADLAAIFRQHLAQLLPLLQPRNAGFVATLGGVCRVDLARPEAELLSWRILATLGSAAAPSEKLALTLEHDQSSGANMAQFVADLPASLNGSEDIFGARGKPLSVAISAGPFGPGFALRLARAEARAIGGSLRRENRRLILTLPALTAQEPAATPSAEVPEHV